MRLRLLTVSFLIIWPQVGQPTGNGILKSLAGSSVSVQDIPSHRRIQCFLLTLNPSNDARSSCQWFDKLAMKGLGRTLQSP